MVITRNISLVVLSSFVPFKLHILFFSFFLLQFANVHLILSGYCSLAALNLFAVSRKMCGCENLSPTVRPFGLRLLHSLQVPVRTWNHQKEICCMKSDFAYKMMFDFRQGNIPLVCTASHLSVCMCAGVCLCVSVSDSKRTGK